MVSRLLLVYAVVELAAIFALVWALGWGWTLLILLATFVLGWGLLAPLAGDQRIALSRFASPEPSRTIALAWRASAPRQEGFGRLAEILRACLAEAALPGA